MTKKERATYVSTRLNELYPSPEIPLDHGDVYQLLVAVLLSAQCTDLRVNQVTPTLFARASSPEAMASVPVPEIAEIIRPCGLAPTKSQNISRLSTIIAEEYGGKVPASWEALEALPGVGHKTASVVMTQGFGKPAFPVDTHIHRLAARWKLSSGKSVETTEKDLKRLFPEEEWGRLHLQIIYYGREYCKARGHDVNSCPICNYFATSEKKKSKI